MSNVKTDNRKKTKTVKRQILAVAVGLAAAASLVSGCGGSKEDSAHKAAVALASQIDSAIGDRDFVGAIVLIDSLNRAYPDELELRKSTMLSRARAMEGMILDSIPVCDAELAHVQTEIAALEPRFVTVGVPGLEGYRVEHGVVDKAFTSHTALQPRLGDDDTPWTLAVNITGRPIDIRGLQLKANGTVVAEVIADNAAERRVRSGAGEMFSFTPEEADVIVANMTSPGPRIVVTVLGAKGTVDIPIGDTMRDAMISTSRMARLRADDHNVRVRRELLERKLLVARDQIANFSN